VRTMEKKKDSSSPLTDKAIFELLSRFKEIQLEDVDLEIKELELWIQPMARALAPPRRALPPTKPAKPTEILKTEFAPPIRQYSGGVCEVRLGAKKAEGGSRGTSLVIGGEKAPPLHRFEGTMPHEPLVALDVFDMPIPLAAPVKAHFKDVLQDPVAWAKLCVDKFGADMITIHLISTDPSIKNTPAKEAAKLVENILQAVDVPIVIGGSGAPEKDAEILEKTAEVAAGERVMLNSANLDMDFKRVAQAAKKYGQVVLSWTQLDINNQKKLNRELLDILPREQIVIDPTTAALGYGLEYTFSIMERIRLAALLGDQDLQMPLASGTTNSWAAREAWMKTPEWGPRELRGPLWETITSLILFMAGCDFFMMMHPAAVKTLKDTLRALSGGGKAPPDEIAKWVTMKV